MQAGKVVFSIGLPLMLLPVVGVAAQHFEDEALAGRGADRDLGLIQFLAVVARQGRVADPKYSSDLLMG